MAAALPRVLLLIGKQSVQPRFAAIGRVAMNDSMLCRFIERGYQTANLLSIWFGRSPDSFLKGTQPRPHAAVLSGPGERFSRTLRSRLCVSHFILIGRRRSRRPSKCQDVDLSTASYDETREPEATLICELSLSFLKPDPDAGVSKP